MGLITKTKAGCPFCGKKARITQSRTGGRYFLLNHHCDDESTTTIRISGTSIAVVEERWGRRPGQKKRVLSGKKKVLCTECGRWVAEHKNGLPRAHGYGRCKMRCRGSAITGDGR